MISKEPDTKGPDGEVIKGKVQYADPKGAPQAWARLQLSARFKAPKQEIEHSGTVQTITTYAENAQAVWDMLHKEDE